jgi:hypothetical protein
MEVCSRSMVQLHSLLSSALAGCVWSAFRSGRFFIIVIIIIIIVGPVAQSV